MFRFLKFLIEDIRLFSWNEKKNLSDWTASHAISLVLALTFRFGRKWNDTEWRTWIPSWFKDINTEIWAIVCWWNDSVFMIHTAINSMSWWQMNKMPTCILSFYVNTFFDGPNLFIIVPITKSSFHSIVTILMLQIDSFVWISFHFVHSIRLRQLIFGCITLCIFIFFYAFLFVQMCKICSVLVFPR